MNSKIQLLNLDEKPREKLLKNGATHLTDSELLAVVLRSGGKGKSVVGMSSELLKSYGGLKKLLEADYEEIRNFKNMGQAKATCVLALKEICMRYLEEEIHADTVKEITKPEQVFKIFVKTFYNKKKEELHIVSLDSRSRIISKDLISLGTLNETLVHPREVYKMAIQKNASSIVLVHNHPSGNPSPSEDDIKITKRIIKAGIILGIGLTDHVIITNNSFTSLKSAGVLAWDTKGGDFS